MVRKNHISYFELMEAFQKKGYKLQKYGSTVERHKRYPLYKIVVNPRCKRTLLIISGFHGEEANGPISLLQIFNKIVRYAKRRHVRLIVYPCVNPAGFQLKMRYSPSTPRNAGNNYFMEYQLLNGRWVGILKPDERFGGYRLAKSPAKEIHPLQRDLLKYPVPEAILDIHQQEGDLKNGKIFAYIYKRRPVYKWIMKRLSKIAPISRNDDTHTRNCRRKIYYTIDKDGFVFLRDGSVTDMFQRMGSRFTVASETDTTLPLEDVCQVNLIWAKKLIELISNKKGG